MFDEIFSVIFGLIWMIIVISVIVKIASGASKAAKGQQQARQNAQAPQRVNAPQSYQVGRSGGQQTFRSVPGATYGSSAARQSAYSGYRSAPVEVKTHSVLLEDRKNDWLAQQFREEDAIKRRGGLYDLGAAHEAECAADTLKREHVKRHNTTGLNRKTFR